MLLLTPEAVPFDNRKVADVHIYKKVPFVRCPAPVHCLPIRVTTDAGLTHYFGKFLLIEMPLLEIVDSRLCFVWGQAVLVAQVLNNLSCFVRSKRDAVSTDHALDGLLPAFGARPFPRDASEISFVVLAMASRTFRDYQRIGYRDSRFRENLDFGLNRWSRLRRGRRLCEESKCESGQHNKLPHGKSDIT